MTLEDSQGYLVRPYPKRKKEKERKKKKEENMCLRIWLSACLKALRLLHPVRAQTKGTQILASTLLSFSDIRHYSVPSSGLNFPNWARGSTAVPVSNLPSHHCAKIALRSNSLCDGWNIPYRL